MNQKIISILILLLLFTTTLLSQVTTSGVNGKIIDNKGEIVVGAVIRVVHKPTGSRYAAVSNSDGIYSLEGLRTGGPYKMTISFTGYKTHIIEGIFLKLSDFYEKDIILQRDIKELSEIIVKVDKSTIFNSNVTGAAQNFDSRKIESIPTISKSIYDVAKLSPFAVKKGNGLSIAGSNVRYNSFQIDGLVNNDVFGLSSSGTNGGQAGTNPISLQAIDEIQIVIAPFDVRMSGFSGGGINATTKSGSNKFGGLLYAYYNNEDFYGKTPGIKGKDYLDSRQKMSSITSKTFGINIGGPIIKNKLFFFINYEKVNNTIPAKEVPGTYLSNIKEDDVKSVINKISELTGDYDGGGYGAVNKKTQSDKILARLDWNINDNNKLMFRYSYVEASKFFYEPTYSYYYLNDAGYTFKSKASNIVVELNSTINENIHNEFRAGWTKVKDKRQANGNAFPNFIIKNLQTVNETGRGTIEFGTERYSGANSIDQDIYTFENNVVWNYGKHKFVIGTYNEFFKFKNLFIANNYGSYEYSSLNDFLSDAIPSVYNYGYSNEDLTGTDKWKAKFGAGQLGLYIQDEWRPLKNIRLSFGLRADYPILFDTPYENKNFNDTETAKSLQLATNQNPRKKILWSPRIGFRLFTSDNHNTLLRGEIGVFTGRIPFVWMANSFSNTGIQNASTYLSRSEAFETAIANGFKISLDPNNQWKDNTAGISKSEVDVISKNFKFPQTLRFDIALEKKLPLGIKATFEALYSRVYNDIWYKNILLKKSGNLDNGTSDKRNLYSLNSDLSDYTYVMLLDNTDKNYSASVSLKLEKQFDMGLDLMLAYTLSESKSVNAGTGSQAKSNWEYSPTYNGNDKTELSFSPYDVRNRVIASISFSKDYGKHFGTKVSLFYQGYNGDRFSYLYSYGTDINKDGKYNDLIYIPTDEELQTMAFSDESNKLAFSIWINTNKDSKNSKGDYIKRYAGRLPFENHIDLYVGQNVYINVGKRRNTIQLNLDIMNITNLLNHRWGCYNNSSNKYGNITPLSYKNGEYKFTAPGRLHKADDTASRWHAQIGLKYIF